MKKALALIALVPALLFANNYIALTFNPGASGVVMTYTYTIYLTLQGPFGLSYTTSTASEVTVPNVPLSTTIDITYTPTLVGEFTIDGNIAVTANNGLTVANTTVPFTMTLRAGETNMQNITVSLPNGGEVDAYIQFYIAGIPAPALLAAAAGALIGFRKRRSSEQ
ncbi:hypothetical protein IPA_07990 [Ignicoccus pacificus DSM 13166]|uniref:Uncharacterized protein n=1 Tax=Ignicoccus pacificus DSM 13166 TaxID=940294 RepID=A0A977PL77_9CREN|nr:hypothetical protein IPA_07990 [Ignicoccus pacificus DSM 13166]